MGGSRGLNNPASPAIKIKAKWKNRILDLYLLTCSYMYIEVDIL